MAPQPKRRRSQKHGRERRDASALTNATLSPCPNCEKLILPHRVCQFCGYYGGKAVISKEKTSKKKNEDQK